MEIPVTDILDVTLKAIEGCLCRDGCPSCIQSPKCGSHNEPLDKHAALMILHELLGKPPYIPKKAKPQKIPTQLQKKPYDVPDTGLALDRVRNRLRRDTLKAKEPATEGLLPNDKKKVLPKDVLFLI